MHELADFSAPNETLFGCDGYHTCERVPQCETSVNGAVALLESLKGQQSLHEQKSGTYERQQLDKVSVIRVEVAKTTRCCIEAVTARETPVSAAV